MEAKIYNQKGSESGKISLPEDIFGVAFNKDLVHDVVTSLLSSARTPVAHVKTRGEVRGGGKKPWKQKGTGRARHGSTRSPIWVGGGVTHGPRNEKNYDRKVNKKAKAKAFACVLSKKFKDGEILFVESLSYAAPKTKEAKVTLENFAKIKGFEKILSKRKNSAILSTFAKDKNIEKSFGNFANIEVTESRNVNILDVLNKKYLVIERPAESLAILEKRLTFAK